MPGKKTDGKGAPRPVGRPSKYRPEHCQLLIDHMRQGGQLRTFGAMLYEKALAETKSVKAAHEAYINQDTIYEWARTYPEFSEAKNTAEDMAERFMDAIGHQGVTGQLKRVTKEEPILDAEGKVVFDSKGEAVMRREYEPATFGQSAWIFMRKNRSGWRDQVNLSGGVKTSDQGEALVELLKNPVLAPALREIALKLAKE